MSFVFRSLVGALALLAACGPPDYGDLMCKSVMRTLSSTYADYQCVTYPTTNYAVGTVYRPVHPKDPPDDGNFYCSSATCLGLPANADVDTDLTVRGFAHVGGHGGSIALNEQDSRSLSIKAILPAVFQVLGANATFDESQLTNVTLQLDEAYPRLLERSLASSYFAKDPNDETLKNAFNARQLVVVVADIVVKSMTVNVCVQSTLAAGIDASLAGKPAAVLGVGTELGVAVSKGSNGCYSLTIAKPVVVAFLAKHQPTSGGLSATPDDFDDWPKRSVQSAKFRPAP